MGLFSRKKDDSKLGPGESVHQALPSSSDIHDPILTAVREQQPWEANANHAQTQTLTPSGALRDVFGNPITNPDISNPARSRDERPLDTIRSFEYATTGDERLRDTMETGQLGFRPRAEFTSMPRFETNPYDNNDITVFGDPNAADDPSKDIYFPPPSVPQQGGKKKRGLFGKKKNKD